MGAGLAKRAADREWALARDVHLAKVDDDVVFLDVDRDAYFCLAGSSAQIALTETGGLAVGDPSLAEDLEQAGLILSDPSERQAVRPRIPTPTESALRWTYPAPRAADVAVGIAAIADVLAAYRGRSLKQILAAVGPATAPAPPTAATLELVDRFHAWIPFAPVSGKCLLRSFILRRLLERRGLSAAWVFGVATWPFSAHCWLQAGEVVLDDTIERVSRFTPILVA